MWPFRKKQKSAASVFFTNTLTGTKDKFSSLTPGKVLLYSCGPTVYGPQHIGNLRAAVFADTAARTLKAAGYEVDRVVNITDVGHLVGDGDEGEDKMAVGAKRENVRPEAIAEKYAKQYLHDIAKLGIDIEDIRFPRATEYIKEQISMIQALEKKGHTYRLPDGVYYDTATFLAYGKLGKRSDVQIEAGARVEMVEGKKNPKDFVLWRSAKPHDLQQWDSPWGAGNPGWSIECSAMIKALLGKTIDIHTGGEDHVSIHHNNEIAQSEGVNGAMLAHFWLHNAFLTIDGQKISKSLGNIFTLSDITERGYHPLSLRYLFLQAHYRSPLSFSWESLAAADNALRRLWTHARAARKGSSTLSFEEKTHLLTVAANDLNTPGVIALLWKNLEGRSPEDAWAYLEAADAILGLSLLAPPAEPKVLTLDDLPEEIYEIASHREQARENRYFAKSDEFRIHLERRGYAVEDGPSGTTYTKIGG